MDSKVIRTALNDSMKWIYIQVANSILFLFDTYVHSFQYVGTLGSCLGDVFRFAKSGNDSLYMFLRQVIFACRDRYFWYSRLQLYRTTCQHLARMVVDAVGNFALEKSPNPWQLVVLTFGLNRFIIFVLLYMRGTWYWLKVNQKENYFQFLHRHHQDWYPDEAEDSEDDN